MRYTQSCLCLCLCLCLLLLTTSTFEQELPQVNPESVGLSSNGLDQATQALQAHIDNGRTAGGVTAVIRDGQIAYTEALGYRDIRRREPKQVMRSSGSIP